jgi:hypothetical protein
VERGAQFLIDLIRLNTRLAQESEVHTLFTGKGAASVPKSSEKRRARGTELHTPVESNRARQLGFRMNPVWSKYSNALETKEAMNVVLHEQHGSDAAISAGQ